MREHVLPVAMLFVALGITATGRQAVAGDVAVAPRGEYATIDTRLATETIQALTNGSAEDRQKAIDQIKAAPDKYAPPVLYALGSVLFQDGKKDEGSFWFLAGFLRAAFDAARCADLSAREAVAVLTQQYDKPIKQYLLQDLDKLQALVLQAIEWDRSTPYHYDHRWINLHGMDAIISGLDVAASPSPSPPLSLPKEQWDDIAEKTRAEFLAGFQSIVASRKKHDGQGQ